MGLHDPFGHLKHKLWPKERLGVKLAIWLSTTKNQELTRFPCVQVACDTPLESSWQRLQLCFRPHSDRRSAHEVIAPQSCRSSNLGNWESHLGAPQSCRSSNLGNWESHLGVPGQKAIWMRALRRGVEYTIWGKVVASPEFGPWWVLWIRGHLWFVLTPKVLQLCINHLVLVLWRSV
jgi:hypothetical protein